MADGDKRVLVVPSLAIQSGQFEGFKREEETGLKLDNLLRTFRFLPRELLESQAKTTNPLEGKIIVPYIILINYEMTRVYVRSEPITNFEGGPETGKLWYLGIPGEIRMIDHIALDDRRIYGEELGRSAVARIINESINLRGRVTRMDLVGFINSEILRREALGLVYLIRTDAKEASSREQEFNGQMMELSELGEVVTRASYEKEGIDVEEETYLTPWSELVYPKILMSLQTTDDLLEKSRMSGEEIPLTEDEQGKRRETPHRRNRRKHGRGDIRRN